METLKPYQEKLMKNLYKKMNIPYTNSQTLKNMNKIYDFIVNSDYATTTKRDLLIIYKLILTELNQKKAGEYVYEKAKEYAKTHNENEYKQCLDVNELKNYVIYDDLYKKVNELINTYNSNPNKKNMINLLILSLYVLHPPLRNDYNDLEIIYDDKHDDRKKNYLLRSNNMYYVIINNDKVIKLHGRAEIPIMDNTLRTMLDIYFDLYAFNNKYLFERNPYIPYTKKQIQYKINQYFKNVNKTLTIYNLRSAYITNFYKNNLDILSRNNLAHNCRHSRETAEKTYCKYL
jgi:hypothetical protein